MLIFSFNGSLLCKGGAKSLAIFPQGDVTADLRLLSKPEEEPTQGAVSWPGEYDFSGITVRGIGQEEGQQVSYVVHIDGVRCLFFSSPFHEWTEAEFAKIGDIDLLGVPSEEPRIIQKFLEEIDPRILLLWPSSKGMDREVLKICGAESKEQVAEFKLKGALPTEGREVVVFGV